MNKLAAITITLILLNIIQSFSQNHLNDKADSSKVDLLYGPGIWNTYFQSKKTKSGTIIRLKIADDSTFYIQWGNSSKMRTFPEKFTLKGAEAWIPKIIDENKDYLVMRQGCGNPCWVGYFLPLNERGKPHKIHEYLGYDLENHLVAFADDNTISIINLRSESVEVHQTKGGTSFFIAYCIDNLSLKKGTLKYMWYPDSWINSKKGISISEKINL